jgi:hypothetical protein
MIWYFVSDITRGPNRLFSHSGFYNSVRKGMIRPKKLGRLSIVSAEELKRCLDALPEGLSPLPASLARWQEARRIAAEDFAEERDPLPAAGLSNAAGDVPATEVLSAGSIDNSSSIAGLLIDCSSPGDRKTQATGTPPALNGSPADQSNPPGAADET